MKLDPKEHLELSKRHLKKVQAAWDEPTDWSDLAIYGFYCLEKAVLAAGAQFRIKSKRAHRDTVQMAKILHQKHALPDVVTLLTHLHKAQKYKSYGDVKPPPLDPEDVASEIEAYVEAVDELLR